MNIKFLGKTFNSMKWTQMTKWYIFMLVTVFILSLTVGIIKSLNLNWFVFNNLIIEIYFSFAIFASLFFYYYWLIKKTIYTDKKYKTKLTILLIINFLLMMLNLFVIPYFTFWMPDEDISKAISITQTLIFIYIYLSSYLILSTFKKKNGVKTKALLYWTIATMTAICFMIWFAWDLKDGVFWLVFLSRYISMFILFKFMVDADRALPRTSYFLRNNI